MCDLKMLDPELDQLGDLEDTSSGLSGMSEGKAPRPSPRACHFNKPGNCDGHAVLTMNSDQLTKVILIK